MHGFCNNLFMRKLLVLTFVFIALQTSLLAQNLDPEKSYAVSCVGFYNLENLFDTLNTNGDRDIEFTPAGDRHWDTEKYQAKLNNLAKVIGELGTEVTPDGVAMLGVAEVEHKSGLDDLVQTGVLKERGYQVVHIEGSDRRGIDVGLLYQPKYFKVLDTKSYVVTFEDTTYHSRDQLLVTGELQGERVHVVVAHWPSRSGGQKRSEPKRIIAATKGRAIVDSILVAEPEAKIFYMGDLNDDPNNKSVTKVLKGTDNKSKLDEDYFYNPMLPLSRKGIGSLAWRDTWNLFDQIVMSPELVQDDFKTWTTYRTKVHNKEYLKSKSGKYKGYPFRSYAGGAWAGGYSDHFPVYTILAKEIVK